MKNIYSFSDSAKLIEIGIILTQSYEINWEVGNYSGDMYDFADIVSYIFHAWKAGKRTELFETEYCYSSITEFMHYRKGIDKLIEEYLGGCKHVV